LLSAVSLLSLGSFVALFSFGHQSFISKLFLNAKNEKNPITRICPKVLLDIFSYRFLQKKNEKTPITRRISLSDSRDHVTIERH